MDWRYYKVSYKLKIVHYKWGNLTLFKSALPVTNPASAPATTTGSAVSHATQLARYKKALTRKAPRGVKRQAESVSTPPIIAPVTTSTGCVVAAAVDNAVALLVPAAVTAA